MKVGVYAIAKNEEQFVRRWAESAADADSILLLDTGSDDGTVEAARALGVETHVFRFDPWRFDTARNMALSMCDPYLDYVIALDLDEVLVPGWRDHLLEACANGVTRPRYKYTWSWQGSQPGLQYGGDKIHSRQGYVWKHPVHEVLVPTSVEVQGWCGLEIHHHPDGKKSRSQYLPLLEIAVTEDPDDDRNAYYFARELFFSGDLERAKVEFQRHLNLAKAVWAPERAQSYRYLFKITGDLNYLNDAVAEAPGRREAWVDMAQHFHDEQMWLACLQAAKKALAITVKPLDYICEPQAWGSLPHDLAAVAAFRCGFFHEARFHGQQAVNLSPYETRLVDNMRFYSEAAA